MSQQPDQDLLLKVLCGEAEVDALPDSPQRRKAAAALGVLASAFAAPPLPVETLKSHMAKVDAVAKSVVAPATSLMLAAVGVAVAALVLFGVLMRGPSEVTPPPAVAVAPKLVDGRWIVNGSAVKGSSDARLASDGKIVELASGRADISSDGNLASYEPVLKLMGGRVQISTRGRSRSAVRAFNKGGAVSVYDGNPNSVACTEGQQAPVYAGANQDVLFSQGADGSLQPVVWPDISTALPPVTAGDVYIRLNTGRVLRAVVKQSSPDGVLVQNMAQRDDQPESLVAAEIAGWTPVETPRGRETYAAWLTELLPAQLKRASIAWNMFISARAVGAGDMTKMPIISEAEQLPEVEYGVRETDGESIFFAKPRDPEFGLGYQMDSKLNVTRTKAAASAGDNGF
jgi:hypothetical protein